MCITKYSYINVIMVRCNKLFNVSCTTGDSFDYAENVEE